MKSLGAASLNAALGVEYEVLVRAPVDSNIDALTPSDVLTGDSPFSRASFEPDSLSKEW